MFYPIIVKKADSGGLLRLVVKEPFESKADAVSRAKELIGSDNHTPTASLKEKCEMMVAKKSVPNVQYYNA